MATTDAIKRLEDAVDIMTDMVHIRRNSHAPAVQKPKYELSPAVIQEAIEGFRYFDKDKDNALNLKELGTVFRAMGQNPSDAELEEIFTEADTDHNGLLEEDEFERLLMAYVKPPEQVEQELKDAFRIFDKDGSGSIDMKELEVVLKSYGEPLKHSQARELISMMDMDGNGRVDINVKRSQRKFLLAAHKEIHKGGEDTISMYPKAPKTAPTDTTPGPTYTTPGPTYTTPGPTYTTPGPTPQP